jgi:AraC-like DNA-binding protein
LFSWPFLTVLAMGGLERNSHAHFARAGSDRFRCAAPGRMRHDPCANLPRHCHREPFAAVVLAGGYDEAGDTGRHRVSAGDIIFHRAFESHLDRFDHPGAEVLVIPLPVDWEGQTRGRIDDPDTIVRACEKDPAEVLHLLVADVSVPPAAPGDWPEALAESLCGDPSMSLERWAESAGLHPGSLSRGFEQVFGTTPAAYRQAQRVRSAIECLMHTDIPLSSVAFDCGFADQAHMTRAITAAAGAPPALLRRFYRLARPPLDAQI